MPFPSLDPVIFEIGPFALRWYALAYIAGLMLGWRYVIVLSQSARLWPNGLPASREAIDDLLMWITFGVILGGRLGYVIFYNPAYFLAHPGDILAVWQGGMAFHGGLLGVIIAIIIFARRRNMSMLHIGDMVAAAVPIGLFFMPEGPSGARQYAPVRTCNGFPSGPSGTVQSAWYSVASRTRRIICGDGGPAAPQ